MRISDCSSDVCSSDLGGFDLLPEPPFATAANSMSDRVPEDGVEVFRNEDTTLSGTVIFPMTPAQRNGLEDLRLVQFHHDDGSIEWIGTYTAFSGRDIQSEIMRTRDFRCFELVPMSGEAARDKEIGRASCRERVCQ